MKKKRRRAIWSVAVVAVGFGFATPAMAQHKHWRDLGRGRAAGRKRDR